MILAGRERESPLVAEDLVFDGIESFLGDRIREGFLLREDELVLSAENADADLHSVGIAFVFLFGQAEVAGTMQAEGVVKTRQSAGIANHAQRRRARIDGLHAGGQLVGAVGVGTIKAVIAAALALIKHDVEKRWQSGVGAAVKPDLDGIEIRGVTQDLFLLWRAQGNVGAAAIGAPAFHT